MLYDQERSTAVKAIESTIQEISQIFSQLGNMVLEQGERIERIDQNIDYINTNMEAGHVQLNRYLRNLSGNRALMLKLFALMLVFIVVWALFL